MTIKLNWKTGLGLVMIVCIASLFGYWLAGGFSDLSDEWVHPSAQGAAWWQIVTALGVPVAISIALFSDWRTHTRFESQLNLQADLDQNAYERQQAEWARRATEAENTLLAFQAAVVSGLIAELEAIAKTAHDTVLFAKHAGEMADLAELTDRPAFSGIRPVYDTLGSHTTKLPAHILVAISVHEGEFQAKLDVLKTPFKAILVGKRFEPLLREFVGSVVSSNMIQRLVLGRLNTMYLGT